MNRRLAPELYLDVVPITGSIENPQLEGNGLPIDYAVKMKRFNSDQLLQQVAADGDLKQNHIDELAEMLAQFHTNIDTAELDSAYGTSNLIWQAVEGCIAPLQKQLTDEAQLQRLKRISSQLHEHWKCSAANWQMRRENGYIRECHGDLHLGNIALVNGRVTVFDGIDFNPELRWIDVMCEIAFIMMDLEYRNLRPYAYRLLNRYLELTGDYDGVNLLPFYVSYRALVRAKVKAIRWSQNDDQHDIPHEEIQAMDALIRLAEEYSNPGRSPLLITHGFSGSGKTTVTQTALEQHAAIRVRSDVERKRLFNHLIKDANLYSNDATTKTYERLAQVAALVVNTRFPVIADATFLKKDRRARFRHIAERNDVEFIILDLQAPTETLQSRVTARSKQADDVSDADLRVLEMQLTNNEPFEEYERNFVYEIDTTKDIERPIQKMFDHR
ncbi:bifunctional aminoglycoside phosphotransferase/ATP-binding protein [Thalassoroseus pseudoceratinae]|uniref:bifunctional aminoglycoside phosphotransferase/ATP-binding protein n=1 Tax=Thalassoroseus pseudoceratinae TaxID=2713176 RepID=UPI001420F371|nr:bifunctional aminoglycoside phosphotransferase/ATP-binding protein [Thalassoroseus pseudoceratinae]